MKIVFHKVFHKKYKKLPKKIQAAFSNRLKIFQVNAYDPILNNHKLHGEYDSFRSINVTSDIRAIYKAIGDIIEFYTIGSHSDLYE